MKKSQKSSLTRKGDDVINILIYCFDQIKVDQSRSK